MAARERRAEAVNASSVRFQWFIKEVCQKIDLTMEQRLRLITASVLSQVVRNISTPVVVGRGPRGGRVVTGRSRAGEFPRAETSNLLRGIFSDVQFVNGAWEGYIGTSTEYGLILETKMERSFLVRTLNESGMEVQQMLTESIT